MVFKCTRRAELEKIWQTSTTAPLRKAQQLHHEMESAEPAEVESQTQRKNKKKLLKEDHVLLVPQ